MAPDLYKYHDYRQYLRDLLEFFKNSKSGPSLRGLAESTGVAVSYLSYVMSGKRPLSKAIREKILKVLGFDRNQKKYFRLLTVVSDTENVIERKKAFDKVQKFRKYQRLNPNETEVYRYLTSWHYPAIRELVQIPGFRLDPKWIQRQLSHPVSIEEVKKALSFLIKYGFIKRDSNGSAKMAVKKLECTEGVYKMAMGSFHRQVFSFASESIERFTREERYMSAQIIPLAVRSMPQIASILEECFKKIAALSDTESGHDAVYHVGLFSFPLAKLTGENE